MAGSDRIADRQERMMVDRSLTGIIFWRKTERDRELEREKERDRKR